MSENKFTRGSWDVLTFSNHELQTDFAMVQIGKRVHMIGYSEEDKANAALIAAALDLHDALEQLVKVIEAAGIDNLSNGVQLGQTVWYVKCSNALDFSKAALAKARGGA